jgi:phage-related protein
MYLKNLIDIYDITGRKLDMEALGLLGLRLQIPSPSYKTTSQEIDGRSGITITDRTLQSRNLTANFITMGDDYKDSLLLRDKLYKLLGNGGRLFVAETEIPNKWWKVYFDEWTPERASVKVHALEIPLVCESGCSESINLVKKSYTTSSFRFNNVGDLTIDPRVHSETQIEFTGKSTNLIIRNKTTGDEWSWTGTTVVPDIILLNGVRSFKNGSSIFGQTNKKLLTMTPGWNDFELVGATSPFTLTIRTRFYFL